MSPDEMGFLMKNSYLLFQTIAVNTLIIKKWCKIHKS